MLVRQQKMLYPYRISVLLHLFWLLDEEMCCAAFSLPATRRKSVAERRLNSWNGSSEYLEGLTGTATGVVGGPPVIEEGTSQNLENHMHRDESFPWNDVATNSASSGWSSSAWWAQYDVFRTQEDDREEELETEPHELFNRKVEKHSSYFFPDHAGFHQADHQPVHDWTVQTEEIRQRIEMASQFAFEPVKVQETAEQSFLPTEVGQDYLKGDEHFKPYRPPIIEQPDTEERAAATLQSPQSDQVESSDVESQLDDFEERALRILSTEVGYKKLLGQNYYAWTDAPIGLAASRFVDTIEDAIIHWRRLPYKLGFKDLPDDSVHRPTVVVLGTGWGAHAFVKVACTFDLRIVVVSPTNHFVFTPMLASAAVGTVEYRSMTEAIRSSNPTIDNYIEGRAVDVDPTNKELVVQLTSLENSLAEDTENAEPKYVRLNYDYLVCAVGTTARSSIVPGAQEFCYNLKTTNDSKLLRTAIGEALEYASRPDVRGNDPASIAERRRRVKFCIIGGGPTGVELAGELNDFLKQICKPRQGAYARLKEDVSVMLVHGGTDLLPAFDRDLRLRALESLQKAGVEVRLNTRSTEVGKKFIRLKEKGADTLEEEIPVGLTVWGAGNSPAPFVQQLLSKLPPEAAGTAGRVKVDRWLRCPTPTEDSFGSILVLGDAACMQTNPEDPDSAYPQTAQVAGQQGAFAARLLNRGYELNRTPPRLAEHFDGFSKLRIWLFVRGLEESPEFTFLNLGILAYVGGGEALAQVQLGDVPIFNYAGNIAFALWRSVYLVKQVATRNRFMVTFDWVKSEIFGRDITRL